MKEQKPVWDRKKAWWTRILFALLFAFFVDSACRGIGDRRRAGA